MQGYVLNIPKNNANGMGQALSGLPLVLILGSWNVEYLKIRRVSLGNTILSVKKPVTTLLTCGFMVKPKEILDLSMGKLTSICEFFIGMFQDIYRILLENTSMIRLYDAV